MKELPNARDESINADNIVLNGMTEAAALHGVEWLDKAACAESDIAEFFNTNVPSLKISKMCLACPVRKECLETVSVLETSRSSKNKGIFAGLSPDDRVQLYTLPKEEWMIESETIIKEAIIYQTNILKNKGL